MADHSIPFTSSMVRALLREIEHPGTGKTATRRMISPRLLNLLGHDFRYHKPSRSVLESAFVGARDFRWIEGAFSWLADPTGINAGSLAVAVQCRGRPRYQPGDHLWVREAWRTDKSWDAVPPRDILTASPVSYEAGGRAAEGPPCDNPGRLRPGMYMTRWASRLTLVVSSVEIQRLQDINAQEAREEGIMQTHESCWTPDDDIFASSPEKAFAMLWDSLNGEGAWELNPFVLVTRFQPVLANIDNGLVEKQQVAA